MADWTAADIPDQTGRTFVVTGANSGLGASTARALAGKGARVIMACRNVTKAEHAAATMSGNIEVRPLDLADLESVRDFAKRRFKVDVLINNAGVMAIPKRRTADGFEMQFGTNHLGHFALTGLMLPRISDRVVTVSSFAHHTGRIHLDDPNYEHRRYERWSAYGQAKLANLMFAYELQRRLITANSDVQSLAAHPGYAATELQTHTESFQDKVMEYTTRLLAQSADMGALPSLYAATNPNAVGGAFIGPNGRFGARGYPRVVGSSKRSKDTAMAARLWELSEKLTGVSYL